MRIGLTLGLALLLAAPCFGGPLRKQCNQQCGSEIAQCVLDHGGYQVAKCRARVRGQCRAFGIQMCLPPTTTTTTTSTTTTIPSAFSPYAGRWEFTGSVVQDDCPVAPNGLQDKVTIRITVGGGASSTVDSVPGLVCTGEFSDNGIMVMSGQYQQDGCTFTVAFDMDVPTSGPFIGAWGIRASCPTASCSRFWEGTWVSTP
jgi:hypothetical protein